MAKPSEAKPVLGPLGLPKLQGDPRKEALEDPGPSWREYFYYSFLKWWIGLGLVVADTWIAASWFHPFNLPGLVFSLAAAGYLEFLLFRYLWVRPADPDRRTGRFRRTPFQLTQFGRWTPEADRARHGLPITAVARGPDPREFL